MPQDGSAWWIALQERIAGVADRVWHSTAAMALEIVSPGDETRQKLPFYASPGVDEVVIVDLQERRGHWLGLADEKDQPVTASGLIGLGPDAARIDWP